MTACTCFCSTVPLYYLLTVGDVHWFHVALSQILMIVCSSHTGDVAAKDARHKLYRPI